MGLTLKAAFTRIMALSGRRYVFTRTSRLAHLIMTEPAEGEPSFESPLAVDAQAREAIMAQVCAHGLGRFRVLTDALYRQQERS
jgi:hypothetical protein